MHLINTTWHEKKIMRAFFASRSLLTNQKVKVVHDFPANLVVVVVKMKRRGQKHHDDDLLQWPQLVRGDSLGAAAFSRHFEVTTFKGPLYLALAHINLNSFKRLGICQF